VGDVGLDAAAKVLVCRAENQARRVAPGRHGLSSALTVTLPFFATGHAALSKRLAILFGNLCLSLSLCANANAQVMADACDTVDPGILHLFDATAFLVNVNVQQLVKNVDQTYSLTPMGTYTNSPFGPLDPAAEYYGTPQAPAGRSGVLISSNTILTSAHATPFDYTGFAYVFGLHAQRAGAICQYPDVAHIPAENVYFASTAANGQYNGVVLNTHSDTVPGDFVVITLDRPVVARAPLAARKSGFASPQDRFAGVSFSQRLIPAKGDFAIQHINEDAPSGVAIANASMTGGASGAPVYNLDAGVVETVGAIENSCVYYYRGPSGLFLSQQSCPGAFYPVNGPVTVISKLAGFHDADLIFRTTFEP
jgi:hypothetical protein